MGNFILVVDDEIDIRRLIIKRLNHVHFAKEILQASNPIEAYEIFSKNKHEIDTIICDQYMPIQNGSDFCALIKRDHPDIKILILTADKRINKSAPNLNADDIFYKPEDFEKLIQALTEKIQK